MSVQQPPWAIPEPIQKEPVLKVYNSLTKSKDVFVPKNGRRVKWYNCGPTVYDASHMGHARNYVTQDILRRIMSDYFGYDIHFVMNITDIDDKIIKRARQNHLLDKFRAETTSVSSDLIDRIRVAWRTYVREKVGKGLPDTEVPSTGEEDTRWSGIVVLAQNAQWKQDCLRRDEKFDMYLSSASRTVAAVETAQRQLDAGNTSAEAAQRLIDDSQDVLAEALDTEFGSTVTDPAVSRSLATYWEGRFFDDMARLRVRDPDTITRVTEYVPEIVQFVERIVSNGYGYVADGSVYFDTQAFDSADNHAYAKLEPWSKGNRELLEDGEGRVGRRSASDFALWKASKEGEPSWPSKWGFGRPGWHIECSVMASEILGNNMDIHSGGIDLAFPHHDNEIAQSEAYHECGAWVNYFLHTGHLHIEGLKMSKSLKNFITIDEILQRHSARQLRLAFLTQLWNAKVDFSESLMTGEVRNIETTLNNFFVTVKALVSQARANGPSLDATHHYDAPEKELTSSFYEHRSAFRTALCDSFNTPAAIDGKNLNVSVVENVASWVGKMLRMFGLGEGESTELGWGQDAVEGNREEVLMPYLRTLSSFRDGVRQLAMQKSETALKDILALCDKLRDIDLVPLGVALDDQEDGKALVKLVPPTDLIKARDEKRAAQEAKAVKKAEAVAAERQKRLQKLERGRVAPDHMLYGSWNDDGIPLTDGEGKELSKNQAKKLQKDWSAQKKLHEEFLAWQAAS
ncbi:tRNA synthetases class I (C) catalytic domain-containing protein [Armillaria luteobubalina]|uniref:cysteine--tRNA ligase n=1 Tax=Armillaria luteobubalina TaxID=153913 RepID=A0AA39QMJ2_9AGAR|nr:tRNA synthetases class I (C) catalytic domain-containing protein [Armillaria luteobubalina]